MILIYLHPSSFFPTNMLSLLIFESCMVSFFLQGNGRKPDVEHVLRTMAGHPQRFLSLRFCFFAQKFIVCACLAACLFALSKQPIFFWLLEHFLFFDMLVLSGLLCFWTKDPRSLHPEPSPPPPRNRDQVSS